jgi:hypothetical protein
MKQDDLILCSKSQAVCQELRYLVRSMGSPVPKFRRPDYVLLWGFLASSQNEIMRKLPHLLMIEDVRRKNGSKKVVSLLSDTTPA